MGRNIAPLLKRMIVLFSSRVALDATVVKIERSFYILGMPRVSQAHLDARRQQILDAARRCFVRNGFHATSMQDVLSEARLSAGAVYRYFRSKDEIVTAIASNSLREIVGALEPGDDGAIPPVEEVVARVAAAIEHLGETQDTPKLAIQIWGEAVRSPKVFESFREALEGIRSAMARQVQRYQDQGLMTRDVPAAEVARVLVAIAAGFMVQYGLMGDVDARMFRDGVRALATMRR
jgi:TetR/AcrR family transcriptional regulator, transcriptional repressor of aconitase